MFGRLGFASRCAASTAIQLQSVRPRKGVWFTARVQQSQRLICAVNVGVRGSLVVYTHTLCVRICRFLRALTVQLVQEEGNTM
jgi:hypothetical protein